MSLVASVVEAAGGTAMTVIQISQRELGRLRVMIDLTDGRLTVTAAGDQMEPARSRGEALTRRASRVDPRVAARGQALSRKRERWFR